MLDIFRSVIGLPVEQLPTPCLLLDRAASDRNLAAMASFFEGRRCKLRPHFKNHKCTTLAQRQLGAGNAVGMTCAKLGEAIVLADAGVQDILIANQIMGRAKTKLLAELAGRVHVRVAVDHPMQIEELSEAAAEQGTTIGVLVEVDIGMGRCGVAPFEPALSLAQRVSRAPGLRFDGLQAYEGHTVYENDPDKRAAVTRTSMQLAIDTRRQIEAAGLPVSVISGGSSGTYQTTGALDGMDEIQAGTYATMDWRYHEIAPQFEIALSVLARVISRREGAAVIDVGVKGAGAEFGVPRINDCPDVVVPYFLAEEHTVLLNPPAWKLGDVVHLLPSHACTTCNLHREMIVHEDGVVVDVWPIEASGRPA